MTYQQYPQQPDPNYGRPQGAASWDYGPDLPQTPGGWQPPPKPGLFPLRPLTFGEIFSASFRMLRVNVAASFGTAFVIQTVVGLLGAALPIVAMIVGMNRIGMASGAERDEFIAPTVVWLLLSFIPGIVLSLIGSALAQVIVAQVVAAGSLARRVTFGEAIRAAWRRTWAVLGFTVLVTLSWLLIFAVLFIAPALMIVFSIRDSTLAMLPLIIILIILAGIGVAVLYAWLQTKMLFAVSAIVLEQLGPIAAIRRSWHLTSGYFWRTFGIYLLMTAIIGVATQVVSGVFSVFISLADVLVPFGGPATGQEETVAVGVMVVTTLLTVLLSTILQAISIVVLGGTSTILYTDCRMRKEGLNIHLQQALEDDREGREPAQDPWTAPDLGPLPEPQPMPYPGQQPPYEPPASDQPYQPYQQPPASNQPYPPYNPYQQQ